MGRRLIILVLISAIFFVVRCAQNEGAGPKKFLVPWRDPSTGQYGLHTVTLNTLDNPLRLRGRAAEIYFQSAFSDSGFQGSIAEPHLTLSGDVYVAKDTESLLALSVYAQMEHLQVYDQDLGAAAQLAWPRKVGVELNMSASGGAAHDNAFYFPLPDTMGVVPFSADSQHVPLAVNEGVIAHEHFHAHFQHEVMRAMLLPLDQTVQLTTQFFYRLFYPQLYLAHNSEAAMIAGFNPSAPSFMNNLVMRAWNEGLADLYAAIYLNEGDFFSVSLPVVGSFRTLSSETGGFMQGAALAIEMKNPLATTPANLASRVYGQGTILARTLYRIANGGPEKPRQFLQRVFARLKEIPAAVSPTFTEQVMSFDDVLPILLKDYLLNADGCRAVGVAVYDRVKRRARFKQCVTF